MIIRRQFLTRVNYGNQNTVAYSHLANSPLVGQIVLATNGATRMTTSKTYGALNRLTQISSAPSGAGTIGAHPEVLGEVGRERQCGGRPAGLSRGAGRATADLEVCGTKAPPATSECTRTPVAGNLYVAQEPEHCQYDLDGNLTSDGRWTYTWDAENRLNGMTVNSGNPGPPYQLSFAYDPKGRRIQKSVSNNGVNSTTAFLYDGWNLIAELGANNSLIRNYVWGNDLSGSAQGAGGVGGLLEVTYSGAATTNAFVAYDGNGNVSALVNAGDGTVLANYDYGPFGETIRLTGALGKANPFRFSTKYQDDESDLVYYGYRYYKP